MFDTFTAAALLNAAALDSDTTYELYKEMKAKNEGGPSAEARAFFDVHKGKTCEISGTGHEGIVYKLNEATSGFYPGSRCPIYVQITNGTCKGEVFEYDLDQIVITQ